MFEPVQGISDKRVMKNNSTHNYKKAFWPLIRCIRRLLLWRKMVVGWNRNFEILLNDPLDKIDAARIEIARLDNVLNKKRR